MHLAVLCSPDSWYFKDLRRAAEGRHKLVSVTFCDLASTLGGAAPLIASGDCRLNEADAVLVRTMPPGSLEQVVFRMDALAQLEAAGKTVLNPPKAVEIAVDKYLASAKLAAADWPNQPILERRLEKMGQPIEKLNSADQVIDTVAFGTDNSGSRTTPEPSGPQTAPPAAVVQSTTYRAVEIEEVRTVQKALDLMLSSNRWLKEHHKQVRENWLCQWDKRTARADQDNAPGPDDLNSPEVDA